MRRTVWLLTMIAVALAPLAPAQAQAPAQAGAPPHAWLFGAWTGGL